jgi:Fe-S-cluster containining protein
MTSKQKHEKLYKRIPKSICKKGCFKCCTTVPFDLYEAHIVGITSNIYAIWNTLKPQSVFTQTCEFIEHGKCSIYENRPFMCRIYGTCDDLKCPNCKSEFMITNELAGDLTRQYILLGKEDK